MTGRRGPTGPERRGGAERRGGPGGPRGTPRPAAGNLSPSGPAGPARDAGPAGQAGPRAGETGAGSPPEPDALERLRRGPLSEGKAAPTVVARGTLRRADVGARPLVLDADDGTTWELLLPPGWVVEAEPGARVTVSGDAVTGATTDAPTSAATDAATDATDQATTTPVGPVLRVRSLSRGD